jgi:GalNAc-alpha-(1->4)-GalNAc-alpha-(1->3)-diNAcBac-PP-undecaprenol alpha-1,4-N-acetyl-D-galactosaminyltransferase
MAGIAGRSVWLVTGSLQGGGAERQVAQMANYWSATGLSVTVATWSGPEVPDFYLLDKKVCRIHMNVSPAGRVPGARVGFNLRRVARLRTLLSKERPDLVLSFITESNVLTILATLRLKRRVLVSERIQPAKDGTVPVAWRLLRRVMYRWADEVVAQTREAAAWIDRRCGTHASVIPNALRGLPDPHEPRQPLIVAIGRLSRQKGFDLLLRAFARLAQDFRQWRVAIIGEGVELANLRRLRAELMLEERVEFVGQVHDIEAWMARAGLVVQPSRFEGFPNAVLESMGMGAPVVCSDCQAGPAELIEDGVNGRLVPVEDVAALAAAMGELMAHDEVRARLGQRALQVRQRFRQEVIMARWEAVLCRRLPRPASAPEARERYK